MVVEKVFPFLSPKSLGLVGKVQSTKRIDQRFTLCVRPVSLLEPSSVFEPIKDPNQILYFCFVLETFILNSGIITSKSSEEFFIQYD